MSTPAQRFNGNADRTTILTDVRPVAVPGMPIRPAPDAIAHCEQLATLLPAIQQHAELDQQTLAYHAQQSDATAADGYWHAAINEARSFLEALVMSMAAAQQRDDVGSFRRGRENQSAFRFGCQYLQALGLLDDQEELLLQSVYGIASAKGAHHGLADAPWSRLARQMVWATAQYLLRRYETWQHTADNRPATESPPAPAPPTTSSHGDSWWSRLVGPWRRRWSRSSP